MDGSTPHPERLGQYEIAETLRLGSIWRTYRGFDPILRRNVALKAVSKELVLAREPGALVRLQEAAKAAIALKHPAIVRVFGYDEDPDSAFIVMEYVEGRSLLERFLAPVPDAVAILVQLLEGLDYAHGAGIIHGSIKPSNLMLTSQGQLRIADFGMLRFDSAASAYMSPEQFIRAQVDPRSDVFSAGVVFYELLTGVNPFAGSPQDLVNRVCNDKEARPSEIGPELPAAFDPVCAKALAKIMNERYVTARAFNDALRGAFEAAFGSPPNTLVSSETVLAGTSCLGTADNGSQDERESRSGGARWNDEVLREVEKQLAVFIGPLARVIVQRASSKTPDLGELYSLAAKSLEREEERRAFLTGGPIGRSPSKPPEVPPQISSPESTVKTTPAPPGIIAEPKPAVRPHPQPEPATLKAELKSADKPAIKAEPKPPAVKAEPKAPIEANPSASVESKSRPEPVDVKPRPAPAKPSDDVTDRLEELLGKQPESLAACLKDEPAQMESVLHLFMATVEALGAAYAANAKIEPLTPQSVSFDKMGKANIRSARPTTHGSGGVVSNPRYAAPEVFAEKSAADATAAGADIYALGMMFYEILLGKKLFEKSFADQQSDLDWLSWHADLEKKAPPLKSLLPDCPGALSDVLESMLEKQRDKRTTEVETVLQRLRSVAQRANRTVVLPRAPVRAAKPASNVPVIPRSSKPPAGSTSEARTPGGGRLVWILLFLVAMAAGGLLLWEKPELYRELITRFHHLT